MRTTPMIPRHLGQLDDGPWLRDRTAVRFCGWMCLVTVGVLIGSLVVGPMIDPRSTLAIIMLGTLLFGALGVVLCPLVMLGVWIQCRSIQYCPDCLKDMTRGACVCPYCGFRDDQAPATAAVPSRHPRLSP
jgi:hypothetical protein